MASFFQRILDWVKSLFWKEEMELTLVGLQNSGKTTFVNVIAVSCESLHENVSCICSEVSIIQYSRYLNYFHSCVMCPLCPLIHKQCSAVTSYVVVDFFFCCFRSLGIVSMNFHFYIILSLCSNTGSLFLLQSGQFNEDMIPTVGFNMRKVTKGNVTIKVSVQ